jgi:hypothetical protein
VFDASPGGTPNYPKVQVLLTIGEETQTPARYRYRVSAGKQ